MGNCQAVDAAALVIQHPSGRIERMYWSVSASEVMKMNPGHYVSLIIPLPNIPPPASSADAADHHHQHDSHENNNNNNNNNNNDTIRLFTRVKLLRSTDTLVLGRAYRLVTSQEVMKVLRAKRYAKMKKNQRELQQSTTDLEKKSSSSVSEAEASSSDLDNISQVTRDERHRQRSGSTNLVGARSKSWRPTLQSISEAGS